jgi:hypothetical protein
MNKQALLSVADVIEHFKRFDLTAPVKIKGQLTKWDDCSPVPVAKLWTDRKTCGCIAGWTVAWSDNSTKPMDWDEISAKATEELGLTEDQRFKLFFNVAPKNAWDEVYPENKTLGIPYTASQAANLLRMIALDQVECMVDA